MATERVQGSCAHRVGLFRSKALLGLVGPDMADGALRAADRVRAVDLDAVKRDEQAAAEALERGEGTLLADGAEAEGEQLGEAVGVHTVEQIADPVGAGDGLHAEERVAIGAGGFPLHAPLEFEEGGGLEEGDREGAGSGVGGVVALVAAPARIRIGQRERLGVRPAGRAAPMPARGHMDGTDGPQQVPGSARCGCA